MVLITACCLFHDRSAKVGTVGAVRKVGKGVIFLNYE